MIVLFRILGKRCNDATDTGGEKRMNYFYFLPVRFVALRHDYIVTGFGRRRFDAAQYARKEVMHQLGHNHANRVAAA